MYFEPQIKSVSSLAPGNSTVFEKGPFNRTDAFHGAGLVIFPMQNQFRLAWQVVLHKNSTERYVIIVDAATGEILLRYNMVKFNSPQGLVFQEHPDKGTQSLESFTGDPTTSPHGWLNMEGTNYTTLGGNNVCTQEDRSGTSINTVNGGYSPRRPDGLFEYNFTNAYMNSSGTDVNGDLDAAITNLFYMVNHIHDYYYKLGFDEAAGNFQRENVTGQGLGNDEVQADAQDGWDTGARNNANFYTPPDGSDPTYGKPRMQMYLFNNPRNAEGDFDGDVIIHEYTHGLSTRLVGGPSFVTGLFGVQSGAMGEGWGDWFAASIYNDPVVGEYVTGDMTKGIRRYALNNDPLTYGNLCNTGCVPPPNGDNGVHDNGEIWSTTLWDLRTAFITKYGYDAGKQKIEQLVVDGMDFSVLGSPSFLDMRDSILLADLVNNQSNGANTGLIWGVFAGRGMGWSATTKDHNDQNPHEAFDLPPVTTFYANPNPFSPNGDGVKETTTITAKFPSSVYWTTMIEDSNGTVVKTCTGTGLNANCTWNGKDSLNVVYPDGKYSYTIRVADQPTKVKMPVGYGTVVIDTVSPSGSISIEGNMAWTKTSSVTLTLNCSDGFGSGCVDMRLSNDGVFDTELWEPYAASKAWTLSAGDGNKAVYVRYRDKAGNRSSMLLDWIKLDTARPAIISVSDTPDPLRHHLGEVSTISFTISDNLSVTCKAWVKIFNPSAILVRTIMTTYNASCPTGGATGSVVWDGKDTSGTLVPAGTYTYKVQLADKALNWSFIKSGTITVE